MNFNRLQYFVEVVEAHSINKAAKKLLLTPSSLLATINAMEKELSCTLLIRSHNGVTPTYAGRILYEDAKNILSMEEKWQNFSLLNNDSIYHIEIGVVPGIQYSIMPELAMRFFKNTPPLTIHDELISPFEISNYILSHESPIILSGYDHGAYNHILNIVENFNLEYTHLSSEPYYAFMSTNHPLAQHLSLTTNDLKDTQMIANNLDITYSYQIKQLYSEHTIFIKNLFYIPSIIKHAQAVALLPRLMCYSEAFCNDNVAILPIDDLPYQLDYIVIYQPNNLLTEEQKHALHIIKTFFNETHKHNINLPH